MAWRRQALFLSVLLSLVAIGALAVKGLALGLDFTGGSQVELHFAQPVSPGAVRAQLADAGFSGPVVAHFGSENDLLIRVREGGEDLVRQAGTFSITFHPPLYCPQKCLRRSKMPETL